MIMPGEGFEASARRGFVIVPEDDDKDACQRVQNGRQTCAANLFEATARRVY